MDVDLFLCMDLLTLNSGVIQFTVCTVPHKIVDKMYSKCTVLICTVNIEYYRYARYANKIWRDTLKLNFEVPKITNIPGPLRSPSSYVTIIHHAEIVSYG